MNIISPYLRQIPPSEEPLSADVFVVEGNEFYYIYDVGKSDEALCELEKLSKPLVVVLSHFHPDHAGNISKLKYEKLYGGGFTCKKLKAGIVVNDILCIDDGVKLEIMRCPSPHAKGSLILTINGEYTLLGDLHYTSDKQSGAVPNMLHVLKSVDTKYFVISHEKDNIYEKSEFLNMLYKYFSREEQK